MRSLEMKFLASSDVSTNSCSSKFHWQAKMLFRVWLSSSPRKGQRPLRLTGRDRQSLELVCACVCTCVHVYLQHVGDDTEAPHVCVERHKVVVDHFRGEKLGSAKIHSQLLPWLISIWGYDWNLYHWDFNSLIKVVDKKCRQKRSELSEADINTYTLARPKSMILILFVTLFTHRMFSGWNS